MLDTKCLSSNKQALILMKFNCSNNYYYLNKLATYVYTTQFIGHTWSQVDGKKNSIFYTHHIFILDRN